MPAKADYSIIDRYIIENPTCSANEIRKMCGIKISQTTMCRRMIQLGVRVHKPMALPELGKNADEKYYDCVCPMCGKTHKLLLFWTGRGKPRFYCQDCKQHGEPNDAWSPHAPEYHASGVTSELHYQGL